MWRKKLLNTLSRKTRSLYSKPRKRASLKRSERAKGRKKERDAKKTSSHEGRGSSEEEKINSKYALLKNKEVGRGNGRTSCTTAAADIDETESKARQSKKVKIRKVEY